MKEVDVIADKDKKATRVEKAAARAEKKARKKKEKEKKKKERLPRGRTLSNVIFALGQIWSVSPGYFFIS